MNETRHLPAALGAALGLLGVGLGAFGAHGLEGWLEGAADAAERVAWWDTAVHYHLAHAVAIVAVAAALGRRRLDAATWCFTLGVAVFSGTLYAMALGGPRWLGAVTPVGGVLLMAGWFAAALAALRGGAQGLP